MKKILLSFLTIWLLNISNLMAQNSVVSDKTSQTIEAYRLQPGEKFILDGRISEQFWNNVTPVSQFTQQDPIEGGEPTERTEIFIAYDDDNLYIAAFMYDSNPDRIFAFQKRRNESLGTDDRFMWILDTFNDGRNAYFFETNPAGLKGDGLLTVGQSANLNKAWDGIWDVRTSITGEGWIVEAQIPFRSLEFSPGNSSWGINFQRTVRRINEEILWSGWRRNQGLLLPEYAGALTGLENINQGLGLEVTPFVTGTGRRQWIENQGSTNDLTADVGFDISYNLRPGIKTSLTVNTDFAETEVDQRRVNLSRFDISFPEQRNFFLEGSSIFSFVPESGVNPYFSRNIGLKDGEPIPIQVGIQALGRLNDTSFGLYQIRTGETEISNREDFTAARLKQNLFSQSSVGIIYTRRATPDVDFFNNRHTMGADLELNTSRFMGDKRLQFQAYFIWNNRHLPDENTSDWDRTSRGIRVAYPNYPFYFHASYREFGEAFNPAVGFVNRVGMRRFQPTFRFQQILSDNQFIRSWENEVIFEYLTDLDFNLETLNFTYTFLNVLLEAGDRIKGSIRFNYENLLFDFDILRNGSIIIPFDEYHSWHYGLEFLSASYRKIVGEAAVRREGFWTGQRWVYELMLTARPIPGVNLSGDWSRTDAKLAEGSFQTDLIRFTGKVDLTPSTAFTNIVQFDNLSDLLGLYNSFRWTIRPGADIYLVHSFNWIQVGEIFNPVETRGAIKINFTHRF
jgi:hypothetical protein